MADETIDAVEPARYIEFKELPVDAVNGRGEPALNRWSHFITKDKDYPASQVRTRLQLKDRSNEQYQAMLYGSGVPNKDVMQNSPQVGIASVWWEGNPCKYDCFLHW